MTVQEFIETTREMEERRHAVVMDSINDPEQMAAVHRGFELLKSGYRGKTPADLDQAKSGKAQPEP